jgi:Zn-dependent protease
VIARGSPFGGNQQAFIFLIILIVALSFARGGGIYIVSFLEDPVALIALVVAFLLAVTFHEFMHAYVANSMGDGTGRMLGRMVLSPFAHLDPIGTIFFALFGFGWGKPVPVNYSRLQGGRRGGMAVAFAGPAMNFVIAAIFAIPFRLDVASAFGTDYARVLAAIVSINVLLGIFNLIPIPPLDGSKVLLGVVPPRVAWNWPQFETFGPFLLLLLIFTGPFQAILRQLVNGTFALLTGL